MVVSSWWREATRFVVVHVRRLAVERDRVVVVRHHRMRAVVIVRRRKLPRIGIDVVNERVGLRLHRRCRLRLALFLYGIWNVWFAVMWARRARASERVGACDMRDFRQIEAVVRVLEVLAGGTHHGVVTDRGGEAALRTHNCLQVEQ